MYATATDDPLEGDTLMPSRVLLTCTYAFSIATVKPHLSGHP